MVPLLSSIGRGLLSLVLPPACPVCARRLEGSDQPCRDCRRELAELWSRGVGGLCEVALIAALPYEGAGRILVHRMKYEGHRPAAEALGTLMAARLGVHGAPDPATILVPVPLHPARLRERGFNQAERLARVVARRAQLDVRADILVRARAAASQTRLDPAARRAAVAGSFRGRGPALERPLLVVDDVWTTGATAGSCRRALEEAGWTGSIGVLVAAQTPPPFEVETLRGVC
jgi:ComF family protein